MNKKAISQLIEILNENNLTTLKYKDQEFELEMHKNNQQPVVVEKTETEAITSKTFNSPLIGVFYSKPAPDKEPFIVEGGSYEVGDTLFIIEAMKVMNEIKASENIVIKKILVKDGEAVGYDQPLFELA